MPRGGPGHGLKSVISAISVI